MASSPDDLLAEIVSLASEVAVGRPVDPEQIRNTSLRVTAATVGLTREWGVVRAFMIRDDLRTLAWAVGSGRQTETASAAASLLISLDLVA